MPNERYARAPKLYIHQHQMREVKANMQYQYRSSKQEKRITEVDESQKTSVVRQRRTRSEVAEDSSSLEKSSIGDEEERARKSFSDMTIKEQLSHLTNKSQDAPRLNCLIKTEGKTHRGFVLNYENEEVKVRSGRREITLREKEIKHIQILSL